MLRATVPCCEHHKYNPILRGRNLRRTSQNKSEKYFVGTDPLAHKSKPQNGDVHG